MKALRWKKQKSKGYTTWTATSAAKTPKGLAPEFRQFWKTLFAVIQETYKPGEFDRIYIELWTDSGRVIAYPGKRGKSRSNWKVGVQLVIPFILRLVERLPDPEEDPDLFESQSMAVEAKVWIAMTEAANDKTVNAQAQALKEITDFKVFRQIADDEEETMMQYYLFV